MSAPPPHTPRLSLVIEPPNIVHPLGQRIPEDLPRRLPHILIPRRKNNLVGFQLRIICQDETVGFYGFDGVALLDLDLLVCDELRGADIDVVTAASAHVFHEKAGAVGTTVEGKPGGCEPLEKSAVAPNHLSGVFCVKVLSDGVGNGQVDNVCIFNWGLDEDKEVSKLVELEAGSSYPIFGIQIVHGDVGQCLASEDKGTTTLHHCDIVAMVIVISGDVVAGVTAAYYDCFLPFCISFRLGELR